MKVDTIDGAAMQQNRQRLSTVIGSVQSSVALGSAQCYSVAVFALRRENKNYSGGLLSDSPGSCAPWMGRCYK